MKKLLWSLLVIVLPMCASAQIVTAKFGKGIQFVGKDDSYALKLGFRFQNLFVGGWDIVDGEGLQNPDAGFRVRRARLKFNGWANKPRLKYKMELDVLSGSVLDAWVSWNFHKNLSIQFGQAKLPSNRERVISSGNLQFVDRSMLNSQFNLDREMGLQLKNHNTFGENFVLRETFAFSQGEGRNNSGGFHGGFGYTFHIEALPMGEFQSKGDYVGSAIKREDKPKLAIGVTYDFNNNAVKSRGQLGSYIFDTNGNLYGTNLHSIHADMMFKYKGFSMMAEYANRMKADDRITDGVFYTGQAVNVQAGYMFKKNYEVALRHTLVYPDWNADETHHTVGFSKFIVGHKLKVQADMTYMHRDQADDGLMFRTQVDIHF